MIFTLNVGNTHTSMMGWREDAAPWRVRWITKNEVPKSVARKLRANSGSRLLVSSVVPARWSELQAAWKKLDLRVVSIRDASASDLIIVPRPSARVGADRIAAAYGALFLDGGRSWVIVDSGTAMTINAVSVPKNGPARFEGGLIVPSAELALRALATGTAQLPHVSLGTFAKVRASVIGRNTREALRVGAFHAQLAAAIQLATAQMREIGGRCGVVLTGGMSRDIAYASAFIAGFKKGVARVEPDLVHRGLLAGALACEFGGTSRRAKQR